MATQKKHLSYSERQALKPSNITLKGKDLAEMRDWHVGDTYEITLKVKMTRKQEGGYPYDSLDYDDEDSETTAEKTSELHKLTGDFDVVGVTSNGIVSNKAAKTAQPKNKAEKFNQLRKQGKSIADARALAGL